MYKLLAAVLLLTVGSAATAAQGAANPPVSPTAPGSNAASAELADGEVRRVDRETRKITLRHGEIKSLGCFASATMRCSKSSSRATGSASTHSWSTATTR